MPQPDQRALDKLSDGDVGCDEMASQPHAAGVEKRDAGGEDDDRWYAPIDPVHQELPGSVRHMKLRKVIPGSWIVMVKVAGWEWHGGGTEDIAKPGGGRRTSSCGYRTLRRGLFRWRSAWKSGCGVDRFMRYASHDRRNVNDAHPFLRDNRDLSPACHG